MGRYDDMNFSDLIGKTVVGVEGYEKGSEKMTLICSGGERYVMEYQPDCCAGCSIEDVCGDINDLLGTIVRAEAPSSLDNFDQDAEAKRAEGYDYAPESYTWTFYILGTNKGTVTIRWYGSSNGYYSESPNFFLDDGE